jgi:hypothetical protein
LGEIMFYSYTFLKPPLLVQRCNGSTAGLGYLKVQGIVNVNCPCKSPHWSVD